MQFEITAIFSVIMIFLAVQFFSFFPPTGIEHQEYAKHYIIGANTVMNKTVLVPVLLELIVGCNCFKIRRKN